MAKQKGAAKTGHPGPGVPVPPPLLFVLGLGAGWWLERRWPAAIPGAGIWFEGAGAGLVVLSVGLALWAALQFRRAGTPVVPVRPATALVTTGPFRYSRNPMYVGLSLGYAGVALILGSLWPLALLPAVWLVIRLWVVRREEVHLEAAFGQDYRQYRRRVRRWL